MESTVARHTLIASVQRVVTHGDAKKKQLYRCVHSDRIIYTTTQRTNQQPDSKTYIYTIQMHSNITAYNGRFLALPIYHTLVSPELNTDCIGLDW